MRDRTLSMLLWTGRLVFAVALAALIQFGACAQKVTLDPNSPEAVEASQASPKATDPRLAMKVTYTSTNRRLHTVIEDLSKETGVVIRCGGSKDDWQVRDIPVVVCARDIPLGRLLRVIADVTHLSLAVTQTDDSWVYRLKRTKALEKSLAEFAMKQREAALAEVNWLWDVYSRLAVVPESEVRALAADPQEGGMNHLVMAKRFADVIGCLGAEAKTKVLNDGAIRLPAFGDDATSRAVAEYGRVYHDCMTRSQPSELDARSYEDTFPAGSTSLEIRLVGKDRPVLNAMLTATQGPSTRSISSSMSIDQTAVRKLIRDLPSRPETPSEPEMPDVDGLPKFSAGALAAKAPLPKLDLVAPKDEDNTFANAVATLSKASGFTIVCEDFISHKSYYRHQCKSMYRADTDIEQALQVLSYLVRWFAGGDDRVIAGSSSSWCNDHARLVPEALVEGLQAKLKGEGAQLDDVVALQALTPDQWSDWIYPTEGLNDARWHCPQQDKPFWLLYNSLNDQQRRIAASESGLPLASVDPAALLKAFQDAAKECHMATAATRSDEPGEGVATSAIPTDWDAISRLKFHLRASAAHQDPKVTKQGTTRYALDIEGESAKIQVSGPWMAFPIFSSKREEPKGRN